MEPHYAMLLALAAVMFAQVITTEESLEGFSSSAVLSVAVLYVVAAGFTATGGLNYFMNKVLGNTKNLALAQLRLMVPVSVISAFMNNTPVVQIMIPIVQNWSTKSGFPVSQFFIPLSFASILGGACTLIGTSTNLVVAGKAETELGVRIGLFDLATVGVPTLLTGLIYILLFSPCLLPSHKSKKNKWEDEENITQVNFATNYSTQLFSKKIENVFTSSAQRKTNSLFESGVVACVVLPHSSAVSQTITKANLRGLSELYLTSVQRDSQVLKAIGPEFVINADDVLFFTGIVENFEKFCKGRDFEQVRQNERASVDVMNSSTSVPRVRSETLQEVAIRVRIKGTGNLVDKTPSDVNFRRYYNAAIISIKCNVSHNTARGNLARTILKASDELVILPSKEFSWDDPNVKRDLAPYKKTRSQKNITKTTIEREFLISMRVTESSGLMGVTSLVGKKIRSAGLRGLPGLFLIALEREDVGLINAVSGEEILQKHDILWFIGERTAFSILRQIPGLVSANDQENKLKLKTLDRRLVECVISLSSDMLGKTIREVRFRSRFRAAVVAVHREGQRVIKKIGDITLKPGDVLLLDTGPYFLIRFRDDKNFLLVAEIENSGVPQFGKFYFALMLVIAMMALFTLLDTLGLEVSLFECAIIASAAMILANIISPERAMKSISWDVIIAIAAAFGLSTALESSGVAQAVGTGLVNLSQLSNTGEVGLLVAIYTATFLVSIVVANNAAALLMFPIAVEALTPRDGRELDLTCECVRKTLFVLMLAASSSFSSPFGYQTNLMVYGPGNYVFTDFLKFGLPMQFWQLVFSVAFVEFLDYWYISWAASIIAFLVVVFIKLVLYKPKQIKLDNSALIEHEDLSSFSVKETLVSVSV